MVDENAEDAPTCTWIRTVTATAFPALDDELLPAQRVRGRSGTATMSEPPSTLAQRDLRGQPRQRLRRCGRRGSGGGPSLVA